MTDAEVVRKIADSVRNTPEKWKWKYLLAGALGTLVHENGLSVMYDRDARLLVASPGNRARTFIGHSDDLQAVCALLVKKRDENRRAHDERNVKHILSFVDAL